MPERKLLILFLLAGGIMLFGSCKTYTVITYESKDFELFQKNDYGFSHSRFFDDNLVFPYFVKHTDYAGEWYIVGMEFYNKTEDITDIKVSDFTVKDENGNIIFSTPDVVLDKSNLRKGDEQERAGGYYRYFFGFDRTIKAEDIKDRCYYVNCSLNGTSFKDVLIRVEEKRFGPFV